MVKRCSLNLLLVMSLVVFFAGGCGGKKSGKHAAKGAIRVPGGVNIEMYGFSLEPSFDPRLDALVPGYRVLNVAMSNNSLDILHLHPEKDRWVVRTGKGKKKTQAIIDMRRFDPEAWAKVPQGARRILAYPLVVPIGGRVVLDLFVPSGTPLEEMTEVSAKLQSLPNPLTIVVRE